MSHIMKKFMLIAGIAAVSCLSVVAQTTSKSFAIQLSDGEEVMQLVAQRDHYAALTVQQKDSPDLKKYFVVTDEERKGPFDEVIDLQAAFDTTGFIYASRKDTVWYVSDCGKEYGPYYGVSDLHSGTKKYSDKDYHCLYLARNSKYQSSSLYNRKEIICEEGLYGWPEDYLLSANGNFMVNTVFTAVIGTKIKLDNKRDIAIGDSVAKICISDNGKNIGVMQKIGFYKKMEKYSKKNVSDLFSMNLEYEKMTYEKTSGSYKQIQCTNSIPFIKSPGDIAFSNAEYSPDVYYSYEDTNGVWKMVKNDVDMKVNVRDINLIQPLPNEKVAYSARPLVPGPNNLDAEKFYVYIEDQLIGGPYLEVRQILPSSNMSTIIVEARVDDGWYLILANGGIGPYADIQKAAFVNDNIVNFKAIHKGEWTSILLTPQGLAVGTIIREQGNIAGIAAYKQGEVQIEAFLK